MKIAIKTYHFLTAMAIAFSASAQKLPSVQQISLRPPANIKIDGKTNEWANKFQAFNHNIDAYYSLANDDDNLYLIVQAKDEAIAKKIIGGGIVLSITHAKNSFDQGVGFGPIFSDAARLSISSGYMQYKEYITDKVNAERTESMLANLNSKLTSGSKELIAAGMKEVDNVISVYNNYGIKSAMAFDKTGALNWELAIPLKYLKDAIKGQPDFYYNLMIRGMAINAKVMKSKTGETATVTDVPMSMTTGKASDMEALMANTDFWAAYKLAK